MTKYITLQTNVLPAYMFSIAVTYVFVDFDQMIKWVVKILFSDNFKRVYFKKIIADKITVYKQLALFFYESSGVEKYKFVITTTSLPDIVFKRTMKPII